MSILNKVNHKEINVDITDKCPLKCPRCPRSTNTDFLKTSKEVSVEDFKKIANHFEKISFCGQLSDPIYHSDFQGILEQCKNNFVTIHTAGQGKSDEWWDNILETTLFETKEANWIFALDGLPKDSHKYRIGQNGEKVWERMKYAVQKFKVSKKHHVTWQYIVFNYNEENIEECKQMAKENGLRFELIYSNRWFSENDEYMPSNKEFYRYNKRVS